MASPQPILELYARTLCGPAAWYERGLESAAAPATTAFRAAYAGVARRLGSAARDCPDPPAQLTELARAHFTRVDWVRLSLLRRAIEATPHEAAGLVLALFESGEIGEQESLLRTLSDLPAPERFLDAALLACRNNTLRVFEAVACENPYPAAYFPELGFNQLVLKALFLEVPVRRIEGLGARVTPELTRMAADYASERRAAGRAVTADTELIAKGGVP